MQLDIFNDSRDVMLRNDVLSALHQIDAERATSFLWQIRSLERQGRQHDLVERRKALRGLHAGLYAAYMKKR